MDGRLPPDTIVLRTFGLITGGMVLLVFGLFLPLVRHRAIPAWPWITAVILVTLAVLAPSRLHVVNRVWMRIGEVLGRINTAIILSIVYYLVVTPIGQLMRAIGKDPLAEEV